MGVIKRGILGGFSGSVGNVVGSSWKGIATMKSKPLSVANPNTAAQVTQRSKMSNIVAFAKDQLANIIKPLNDRFASNMSGFNLFVQRNIDLFTGAYPNPPENLILGSGSVTAPLNLDVDTDVSDQQSDLSWDDNSGVGDALGTDVLFALIYNNDLGTFSFSANRTRAQGSANPDMPPGTVAGNSIRVWACFRRADGTKVSDTAYVAKNAVA